MSKQDRQGVRTAAEIEQKYGLGQFMYNQKQANAEMDRNLTNLGELFNSYKTETDENISKLQKNTNDGFNKVNETINNLAVNLSKDIDALSKGIFNMVYPVGAIYISVSATNPSKLFGGTWEQIKDRFLLASGNTYSAGATGGETEHTLTQSEMPKYKIGHIATAVPTLHNDWDNDGVTAAAISTEDRRGTVTGNEGKDATQYGWNISTNGGGKAHNNMPPYLAVYVWKRTA